MKYIITILCFLGTTLCNDLVSIQVVGNDSRWFIWEGKINFENKFKNLSDKEIKDFVYEISIYDKNDILINSFYRTYNILFYLSRPIQPNKSVRTHYRINKYNIVPGYPKNWKVRKVKTRVIEITYLDGTIIKNPTELIEIKRKQSEPFKYMFQSIFIFILLWGLVGD